MSPRSRVRRVRPAAALEERGPAHKQGHRQLLEGHRVSHGHSGKQCRLAHASLSAVVAPTSDVRTVPCRSCVHGRGRERRSPLSVWLRFPTHAGACDALVSASSFLNWAWKNRTSLEARLSRSQPSSSCQKPKLDFASRHLMLLRGQALSPQGQSPLCSEIGLVRSLELDPGDACSLHPRPGIQIVQWTEKRCLLPRDGKKLHRRGGG